MRPYCSASQLFSAHLRLLGSLAQDVTIASPTKDSSVTPGQKLKIVLQLQGTTSSVNHIAFSTGFKTTSKKDPTSLGRPYVGSVFPSPQSTDVVLDASKGTYTYEIDVPAAKDFLDGFSAPYELTVSDTYLLGATFTPSLKLTSVTVNMQNNNSTNGGSNNTDPSANNPSGGTGSNTSPSISNGWGVDRPGFGGLQADVPKCHRCVTLVQFMDCRLMAGVDLWRAKLPKIAAEGGIGPPPPSLAASVAAPLEDNYTLRAAKVCSRSRDGSSVGDALI
ncbi:hypothetical protein PCANC_02444 [Puccinia coronata f. sp. avenae]|uniref:Uncharacterized protein n=1 Tax=Puccinia coronata f. sp. avenae TaxID=200324 RepID=A0A2N5W4Y5_9BASI|nr:hypothetical protein PCANC_02444 [Puccinia coronata f. sp. avenae]